MDYQTRLQRYNELSELNWAISKALYSKVLRAIETGIPLKASELSTLISIASQLADSALLDRAYTRNMDLLKAFKVLTDEGVANPEHCGMIATEVEKITESIKRMIVVPKGENNDD
jgi:hypothetical protein